MLDALFKPRAIAVIGASNNPYSIGNIVVRNLLDHGSRDRSSLSIQRRAHSRTRSLPLDLDVPGPVDLVNISIKAALVPDIIEQCGRKGVKFVIVHSAGFKEVGEEGIQREREMVQLAHRFGMRVFGPNSQGIQNSDPNVSVYANFTFVPMMPGNVSIVAQGGGMGELLKLHLHRVGVGHRMYASYGNECDLTLPEILEYYGNDEGTRAIMVQVESFKDPARFLEVAERITPHKPILALKAGRTKEGSVAVSSHTGALVDQGTLAEAIFRRAGVVPFNDTGTMIETTVALSMQPVPKGSRLGIITNTGGPAIQAVDTAIAHGLQLASWSEAGRNRLAATQYPEASLGNPVDVVATAGPDQFHAAVDTLLSRTGRGLGFGVLRHSALCGSAGDRPSNQRSQHGFGQAHSDGGVHTDRESELIRLLRASGLPVYDFPEQAARSLAAMAHYQSLRSRPKGALRQLVVRREEATKIVARYAGTGAYMSQLDAFEVLACYGIDVPRRAPVRTTADLPKAVGAVGFPCVLKVDSPQVVHKSEAGGVVLGLTDIDTLEAAWGAMRDRFGEDAAFLLLEQKPAGQEVIIGTTEAPGLGSLVMFGLGGVLVEASRTLCSESHRSPIGSRRDDWCRSKCSRAQRNGGTGAGGSRGTHQRVGTGLSPGEGPSRYHRDGSEPSPCLSPQHAAHRSGCAHPHSMRDPNIHWSAGGTADYAASDAVTQVDWFKYWALDPLDHEE